MNVSVTIASLDEFRMGKDRWNALALDMKHPSVFCTWEWVYTWWEHFGDSYKPLILFIRSADKLVGIFPLASRKRTLKEQFSFGRVLTFCGSEELYPDYMDMICAEKHVGLCLRAAMDFLSFEYRDWDLLQLSYMSEEGATVPWLRRNEVPHETDMFSVSTSAYIPIEGDLESYEKTLKGHMRRELKRRRRNLYERYSVHYARYDPKTDPYAIKALFDLHRMRMEKKKVTSSFSGEKLQLFHERISKLCYDNGWLCLRFLRTGQEPISANYCFSFGGYYFLYQVGFDTSWESKGVGSVLLYEMIKEAFEGQAVEFDFLRGGEGYKSMWAQNARLLISANIYNKTLLGKLIKFTHRTRTLLKRVLKR